MNQHRVLIVDDEIQYVESLMDILKNEGYAVETAKTMEQTMGKISTFSPHIVVLDLDLRNNDGQDITGILILERLRSQWNDRELPVIIVSGTGNPNRLFDVMKIGANDYQEKPLDTPNLLGKIDRLLKARHLVTEPSEEAVKNHLVGRSPVMMNLAKNVFRAAQADADALFLGENGTGKTLVAEVFHQVSRRHTGPFIRIDCNTIAGNLFESEIFGYAKYAFTDAKADKPGRIAEAEGGILFIDEIGDLTLEQQGKLLTLLETKKFTPVGSLETRQLDVLILVATNANLYQKVKQGKFRKDLFYRLHNTVIQNPPLKDHLEDIPDLVAHFIKKHNRAQGKCISSASGEVLAHLQTLSWDGNVRQLGSCIEEGVKNCLDHQIILADIQPFLERERLFTGQPSGAAAEGSVLDWDVDYKTFKEKTLRHLEREYLQRQLEKNHWNVSRTAKHIGLPQHQYLNQLMRRLDLKRGQGTPC
jgi:DNA-binding NtrC family response regulator